jgi:hypothetical protein
MTLDEANKVATIISQADGGCSHCVEVLRELCEENFPEFCWRWDLDIGIVAKEWQHETTPTSVI